MTHIKMSHIKLAGLGLAMALVGCAAPPQTPSQLSDRLGNAEQISDTAKKDDALQQIAKDAANGGSSQICINAVSEIANSTLRDNTAHGCADTFNGRGDRMTAELLVNKISDSGLRNQILQAYASQPAPAPR